MIIRPYEDRDWPRICTIHDVARMEELRLAGLEEAFLPLEIAAVRENLFDYTVLVCENDNEILGFAAYEPGELAWLYVHPEFQRMGVGTALIGNIMPQLKTDACVEVLKENKPARCLYRKLGFTEEELLTGRMPGNERFSVAAYRLKRPIE